MPAGNRSLDKLRQEIDQIDTAIHDLLIRRTELARTIGGIKGDGGPYLRPGREALILRRLVERHRGAFPASVVVRIWREIISALTALQGPFALAVSVADKGPDLRRIARDHFGSQTPVKGHPSALGVLRAVAEGEATVGVLPLPRSEEKDPWWRMLARDGVSVPRIVARLPFAASLPLGDEDQAGLAVALMTPEASGHDHSYVILETDESISRGALKTLLGEAGLAVIDLQAWTDEPDRRLHLVEVEGLVADGDPRLATLREEGGRFRNAWAAGGFAVPLSDAELTAGGARD